MAAKFDTRTFLAGLRPGREISLALYRPIFCRKQDVAESVFDLSADELFSLIDRALADCGMRAVVWGGSVHFWNPASMNFTPAQEGFGRVLELRRIISLKGWAKWFACHVAAHHPCDVSEADLIRAHGDLEASSAQFIATPVTII